MATTRENPEAWGKGASSCCHRPKSEAVGVLMLPNTVSRRLEAIPRESGKGKRINGLFRLMENLQLWLNAYGNIYSNKGALTRGVDGVTMEGFCDERAVSIVKLLKEQRYRYKPARRTYVPKRKGGRRPLGIPNGNDKLVQEVVRYLLELVYEPVFSEASHGFRPKRSCHTALEQIQKAWSGTKWLIEVDIKSYFDTINHEVLIKLLTKKIDDKRFLSLIRGMLKAGYLEDWKYHRTYSGSPQGAGASPILANIYLHELDQLMRQKIAAFNKGTRRRRLAEYTTIGTQLQALRKRKARRMDDQERQLLEARIRHLNEQLHKLPSVDPVDPGFRRLRYCRYGDDFLMGLVGTRREAMEVMSSVKQFLHTRLNLSIAEKKTKVTHAKDGARFLGYEVRVYSANNHLKKVRYCNRTIKKRVVVEHMQIRMPKEASRELCAKQCYGNFAELKPLHRPWMEAMSDAEIILTYNAELRGFLNYYSLAQNMKDPITTRLGLMWRVSLLKTLARKHKSTVRKVAAKLRKGKRLVYRQLVEGKPREIPVLKLSDVPQKQKNWSPALDSQPVSYLAKNTELVARLEAHECEYCGKTGGYFEVHHVRKLSDLKKPKTFWEKLMSQRRRKTLVLCIDCHDLLHAGKLPDWRHGMRQERRAG